MQFQLANAGRDIDARLPLQRQGVEAPRCAAIRRPAHWHRGPRCSARGDAIILAQTVVTDGPAVRCKRTGRVGGERSCINVSGLT